jgi:hypothetical protein
MMDRTRAPASPYTEEMTARDTEYHNHEILYVEPRFHGLAGVSCYPDPLDGFPGT